MFIQPMETKSNKLDRLVEEYIAGGVEYSLRYEIARLMLTVPDEQKFLVVIRLAASRCPVTRN
jgi:hypothetical protein